MNPVARRLRREWSRLQLRLTALVVGLLVLGFSAVGVVQHYVLRQYLLGQAARSASVQVGIAAKAWRGDPGRPAGPAPGDSLFSVYGADGQTLARVPPPALPGKVSPRWVEPPPRLLATAAAMFSGPGKQQPDAPPLARLLKLVGLGQLDGEAANQQVLAGPDGEVMLTVVPLDGGRLLAMETSLADADAMVQADLLIFSLAAAVTLVATAVLGIWLTARSLAPLDRVSAVAGEITAGAYDRRTGLRGSDQVASLAAAFDRMVDRLQERIELERRAEERTRRFLADASHELRTPMAALLGHVEVLHRGASRNPADLEHSLAAAHASALRMSRLLRDMLEIARLEQPELTLRRERVEVAGILAQAVRSAERSTGGHRVRIEPADPSPVVVGDPDALARILVNLLDNAARYSPAGTAIRVRAETNAGGAVEIAVSDQGPGIPAEERERVFERLYRGEHARAVPGAGLGLAICRALARHHGGDVSVRGEPGTGSTFVLRLPPAP